VGGIDGRGVPEMNPVIDLRIACRSIRAYEERDIQSDVTAQILRATMRAHGWELAALLDRRG
jgi:hypothetical protein